MITVTDLFCGAGGSGLGAASVPGVELWMAANHSPRAIETHQLNFPDCDHDCADISQVEPRRYRRTNILWASPECTNHSVAKGRRRHDPELALFGETVPDHVEERSRATMWDVPRFAEVHKYDAVIVENVVDAACWPPFQAWLTAMASYGYTHQIVFLNSMHAPAIAAPRAPQSRDRMYVVFWREGNPAPDLEIRPRGWCEHCGREVETRQTWKPRGRTWPLPQWGRYRAQYLYTCTTPRCGRPVEPYALPAAAVIDWNDRGERIGDRAKPLSDKTLARIRTGLERYGRPPFLEVLRSGRPRPMPVSGPMATIVTDGSRHYLVDDVTRAPGCPPLLVPSGGSRNESATLVSDPFRTRTTTEWEGLLIPVEGRDGKVAAHVASPMRTQTARHETALVVPYYSAADTARPAGTPVGTLTTRDRYGLAFIAELRGGGSTARPVTDPLATVCANGNHHGLVQPTTPPAVEDCTFRMLTVPEIQAAMAFTPDYVVTGNKREQVKQLGNGVTPPAAEWLIRAVTASLTGEDAAAA